VLTQTKTKNRNAQNQQGYKKQPVKGAGTIFTGMQTVRRRLHKRLA
jgi:hypothetical protein